MEILELEAAEGRLINRFDSRGARHVAVARLEGRGGISVIRLAADAVLGRHPAIVDQLFYVVQGDGWVAGHDGTQTPIRAGQAAYWTAGEEHESGTDGEMTALVIEAETCVVE
jgi:quercetin dioxygenase-like cupin family protein